MYLPPDGPDLKPIERGFAELKAALAQRRSPDDTRACIGPVPASRGTGASPNRAEAAPARC